MEYQHICHIKVLLFSQKDLKSFSHDIYIHTSPDFSHRVFKEIFRLITRPQEDQIDYKTTKRINWSRGSVVKKIKLVINYYN